MVTATQHHASSFPFLRTSAHYLKSFICVGCQLGGEQRCFRFRRRLSRAGWAAVAGSRSVPAAPRHTLPALPQLVQSQGQVRARRVPQLLALTSPGDGACAARQTSGRGRTRCSSPAAACPSRGAGRPSGAGKLLWPRQSTGDPAHPSLSQPQLSL